MAWYKYQTSKGPYWGTWSRAGFQKAYPGAKIQSITPITQAQAQRGLAGYGYTLEGTKVAAKPSVTTTKKTGGLPSWAPQQADIAKQIATAQAAAQQFPADIQKFLTGQKEEAAQFTTEFQEAVPGLLTQAREQYGVPGLQEKAANLGDLATSLANRIVELQTNVLGTGAGGYATAEQVDKAIQAGYLPRAQMAEAQAQTAQTQLGTAQSLAQTEFGNLLRPYEMQGQLLSDRLAREATGYTRAHEARLDTLLKIPSLTLDQQRELNSLAIQEQQNIIAREQIQAQIRVANISASAQRAAGAGSEALARALADAAAGAGGAEGGDIAGKFMTDLNRVGTPNGISLLQLMEMYASSMDYNTILQSYRSLRPNWRPTETDAQLQAAYNRGRKK